MIAGEDKNTSGDTPQEDGGEQAGKEVRKVIPIRFPQPPKYNPKLFTSEGDLLDEIKQSYLTELGTPILNLGGEEQIQEAITDGLERIRRKFGMTIEDELIAIPKAKSDLEVFFVEQKDRYAPGVLEKVSTWLRKRMNTRLNELSGKLTRDREQAARVRTLEEMVGQLQGEKAGYEMQIEDLNRQLKESGTGTETARQDAAYWKGQVTLLEGKVKNLEVQGQKAIDEVGTLISENAELSSQMNVAKAQVRDQTLVVKRMERYRKQRLGATIAAAALLISLGGSLWFNWQRALPEEKGPGMVYVPKSSPETSAPSAAPPELPKEEIITQGMGESSIGSLGSVPSTTGMEEAPKETGIAVPPETEKPAVQEQVTPLAPPLSPVAPIPAAQETLEKIVVAKQADNFWKIAKAELGNAKNAEIVQYLNTVLLPANNRKSLAECPMDTCPPNNGDPTNPNRLLLGEEVKIPMAKAAAVAQPTPKEPEPKKNDNTQSFYQQHPQDDHGASLQPTPNHATQKWYQKAWNTIFGKKEKKEEWQAIKPQPEKQEKQVAAVLDTSFKQRITEMAKTYDFLLRQYHDPQDENNSHVAKADEEMLRRFSYFGNSVSRLHFMMQKAARECVVPLSQAALHLVEEGKFMQVYQLHQRFADGFSKDMLMDGARKILGVKKLDEKTYDRIIASFERPMELYTRPSLEKAA